MASGRDYDWIVSEESLLETNIDNDKKIEDVYYDFNDGNTYPLELFRTRDDYKAGINNIIVTLVCQS